MNKKISEEPRVFSLSFCCCGGSGEVEVEVDDNIKRNGINGQDSSRRHRSLLFSSDRLTCPSSVDPCPLIDLCLTELEAAKKSKPFFRNHLFWPLRYRYLCIETSSGVSACIREGQFSPVSKSSSLRVEQSVSLSTTPPPNRPHTEPSFIELIEFDGVFFAINTKTRSLQSAEGISSLIEEIKNICVWTKLILEHNIIDNFICESIAGS
jgi:hypothetical protein